MSKSIDLLTFDASHELFHVGSCKVEINAVQNLFQINVHNGDNESIVLTFLNHDFIQVKNILCIAAPKPKNNIILIFLSEATCKKVCDIIIKIKETKLNQTIKNEQLRKDYDEKFKQFLLEYIPTCNNIRLKDALINALTTSVTIKEVTDIRLLKLIEKQNGDISKTATSKVGKRRLDNGNVYISDADDDEYVPVYREASQKKPKLFNVVNTTIIPSNDFELIQFEDQNMIGAKLSILLPENKELCHEFFWKSTCFYCDGCRKNGLFLKAILKISATGDNSVEVDETSHICKPRIFRPFNKTKNIIKKGGFEIKIRKTAFMETEVLIIFDDADKQYCRILPYHDMNQKYICPKCRAKGNRFFAFLYEPKNAHPYVQLGYGEHVCDPVKYFDLDPKIYINP